MIWKKYIINYYIYGDLIMKMEIELTDEQAKKVEVLKENGMDIGDAVEAVCSAAQAVWNYFFPGAGKEG